MKVLVCGGRDFVNQRFLFATLDKYYNRYYFTSLIEGGAKGADKLAKLWAQDMNLPIEEYKADWDKYGSAAGPIRNQQMLDEGKPDLVIAFDTGGPGTNNMCLKAESEGIEVIRIRL